MVNERNGIERLCDDKNLCSADLSFLLLTFYFVH